MSRDVACGDRPELNDAAPVDWSAARRTTGKISWHRGWPGRHAAPLINIVLCGKKGNGVNLRITHDVTRNELNLKGNNDRMKKE